MTTEAAAAQYLAEHLSSVSSEFAVHNPNNLPLENLPVIYGFNNGGRADVLHAILLTQDGTVVGGHCCSHEGYMAYDLGCLVGARPDRHEKFRKHYPNGYRMEFVGFAQISEHAGLKAAFAKYRGE